MTLEATRRALWRVRLRRVCASEDIANPQAVAASISSPNAVIDYFAEGYSPAEALREEMTDHNP